jgi:hypothetical protein
MWHVFASLHIDFLGGHKKLVMLAIGEQDYVAQARKVHSTLVSFELSNM